MRLVRRHPVSATTTVLAMLAAVPGGVAGLGYVRDTSEPGWVALHYWVREQLAPIIKIQETQAVGIDRFLLFQQEQALSKAREDPGARTSPIVKERVDTLERQIRNTRARICKSTSRPADCD